MNSNLSKVVLCIVMMLIGNVIMASDDLDQFMAKFAVERGNRLMTLLGCKEKQITAAQVTNIQIKDLPAEMQIDGNTFVFEKSRAVVGNYYCHEKNDIQRNWGWMTVVKLPIGAKSMTEAFTFLIRDISVNEEAIVYGTQVKEDDFCTRIMRGDRIYIIVKDDVLIGVKVLRKADIIAEAILKYQLTNQDD